MKVNFIEKIGSVGTFLTAAACPVCWPLFIPIGSALGLGFLQPYESTMMNVVFPIFVGITLIGSFFGIRIHGKIYPAAVSVISCLLILYGFYGGWHREIMYVGIIGVLTGSLLGIIAKKQWQRESCKIKERS